MIRASLGNEKYWNEWTNFSKETIKKKNAVLDCPAANEIYEAQFVWNLSGDYLRLILRLYSYGDTNRELSQHFPSLLDAWELSNKCSKEICAKHQLVTCRDWQFELSNLNHYNWCFWLVGLALTLEIPEEQWQRLLGLIGGEGEDLLLDRVISSRQPSRQIGNKLLHAKPYGRLLKAIDAPKENQATSLRDFVEHWYVELKRKGEGELWWYIYGDTEKHPLEKGSYFGRWCIEAAAAVKAFALDDGLCLGHEHYPGDLLRPDGPSTHPARDEVTKNWLSRLFSKKK